MTTQLRNALLRGKRRPRNFGAGSPTNFRGDGYEFAELRQYVAGDDTRRIDWAATARAGTLQTRVVLEDVALTLAAIIDDSPSMQLGRARPLTAAATEAMTTWYEAALADDRCARITATGLVAPLGMRGFRSALACANARSTGVTLALPRAFDIARAALPRGAALLVVSDFFDLPDDADRMLGELGVLFDCTALFARDPWYDGLPLGGFVRLQDAETGAQRQFFIGRKQRAHYVKSVAQREELLSKRLGDSGWRTGLLHEDDGRQSLLQAFGLR
ncbi:MAG: DUF58 domain-containing protein [Candidatus Eremiobacteraeota bacterium]|nr:DUF58 domain-containing protein [Candidatus Eremiobacteraeota bacterium]